MAKEVLMARKWWPRLFKIVRFVIPVVILTIIFARIDFGEFKRNIAITNLWLFIIGVLGHPLVISIGSIRWRIIVQSYLKRHISAMYMFRHYWVGLALGIFFPASIGWDVYRVMVVGRRYGNYVMNIVVVIVERVLGLSTIIFIVFFAYPMVKRYLVNNIDFIYRVMLISYFSFFLIISIFIIIRLMVTV